MNFRPILTDHLGHADESHVDQVKTCLHQNQIRLRTKIPIFSKVYIPWVLFFSCRGLNKEGNFSS